MKKIILLKGLPASGKSTRAKQYCKDNPGTVRLNKDLAREQYHFGKYSKSNEQYVLTIRDEALERAIIMGKDVIIDDTNFNPSHKKNVVQCLQGIGRDGCVEIEEKFFDTGLETCKRRNLKRRKKVPEYVIQNMYDKAIEEGYEFKEYDDEEYKGNPLNPQAVIFDIDGTLAKMDGRSPYDYSEALMTDKLNQPVYATLNLYRDAGYKIIIFTGRSAEGSKWTKSRLEKHNVSYDHFAQRDKGDTRCDTIVKREMFDKIKDDYNVIAVYDDRDRVVDMWRGLGVTCFQVDYGNF